MHAVRILGHLSETAGDNAGAGKVIVEPMPVDAVVGRKGQFDQRKYLPTIERQVAAEGVVLYE